VRRRHFKLHKHVPGMRTAGSGTCAELVCRLAAAEKLGVAHRGRTPSTRGQHGRVADNKVAATISKVRILPFN
jgi:hypothetical protein